ncbi:MAG: hypothetical protein K8R88_10570 [Armatimonadetes bacterium]|nr:hypothetical protein [Armatimonadota bacterium]
MKLNLLPNYVSKGASAKVWLGASVLFTALAIGGAVFMTVSSKAARDEAEVAAKDLEGKAAQVVVIAKQADTLGAASAPLTRNLSLAQSIEEYPYKVTGFYRTVQNYIPGFFRINQMSLTPVSETSCTLTLAGTINSYQQYADLMLALLRIPGAKTVTRAGYVLDRANLNGITETDTRPEKSRSSETPLPKDPVERIAALVSRASAETTGFTGAGNYASTPEVARQAIPNWQNITVTVELDNPVAAAPVLNPTPGAVVVPPVSYNFMVPIPQDTLRAGGGAAAPGVAAPGAGGPPAGLGIQGAPGGGAPPQPGGRGGRGGEDS